MRLIDAELMNQICNHTSLSTWIPTSVALPNELKPVLITWVNKDPMSYEGIGDEPVTDTAIYYKGQWWWYSNYCEEVLLNYGKAPERHAIDKSIDVIAWQPYPKPYAPSDMEDIKNDSNEM